MKRTLLFFFLFTLSLPCLRAQKTAVPGNLRTALLQYFSGYRVAGYVPHDKMKFDSLRCDEGGRTLTVYANEPFCSQPLTPERVKAVYKELSRQLPPPYNTYALTVCGKDGKTLDELIPNVFREGRADRSRLWGDINYTGNPWVSNLSRPYMPSKGLQGRHLMVNASHGRYYREGKWKWQRPPLFCTNEDLLTQSFVNPYLIPMLENAGAVVVTARERDTQTMETVVDNDKPDTGGTYTETGREDFSWHTSSMAGFSPILGVLTDSVFPFLSGTVRQISSTTRSGRLASATWSPRIPKTGKYAVYVSYATVPGSIPDARYTVFHKGGRTQFRVNQQMGGGTWVYLGTFDFEEGEGRDGRVVLTNKSDYRGIVTADGVRFGGGVGRCSREDAGTSGFPRFLEGARYHAQWCGLADTLFNKEEGMNDYNDDIRSRSYLLNNLGGGSVYMPGMEGRGVPLELVLALHSDAGVREDASVYGSLAICTTVDGLGNPDFAAGISRQSASDFASLLLSSVTADLTRILGKEWTQRELWDRNYGETRTPDVPAVILEMFSHQNYGDMKYAHDPNFKFAMSRAIYKAILRFVSFQHGEKDYVVQPLPPSAFSATVQGEQIRLSWQGTRDPLCESAAPVSYVVYTKVDDEGYDNGRMVEGGKTELTLPVSPGLRYSFKVTAVNRGGESFPSEELTVRRAANEGAKKILIVNGFDRLSGPARIERADSLGFDLKTDPGVPYHETYAFAGEQRCFNPQTAGVEGADGLGYSGLERTGDCLSGNTFDYAVRHGKDFSSAADCELSSCSRGALLRGDVRLSDYDMVDYICGLQRDVPYNLRPYKTFDAPTRRVLSDYLSGGGRLFVSGCFIGSDMQRTEEERRFVREVFKYDCGGSVTDGLGALQGLNLTIPLRGTGDGGGYVVRSADVLLPADPNAFTAFAYGDGSSAGIAYTGNRTRIIAIGFPFEGITSEEVRRMAAGAILSFLTQ